MSRYDVFRRRIAPVAFVLAIGLLVRDSCNKQHRTKATFVLDLGTAAHQVRAIDADVWTGPDAPVATYHRVALDGMDIGPTRFETSLPAKDGELRIDVDLGTGHRLIRRHFHIDDGSVVDVPLARDLQSAPAPAGG